MDCRTFHHHHLAFVDDTLPGADRELMERHRQQCASCERHDSLVRRGIFLARNIPLIEPSPDFSVRLQSRLKGVRQDRRPVMLSLDGRFGRSSTFGTVAIGLAACAILAVGVTQWSTTLPDSTGRAAGVEPGAGAPVADGHATSLTAEGSRSGAAAQPDVSAPAVSAGYTLDMQAEPSYVSYDGALLMQDSELGIDPALVTSASAGLSLWPALIINDDLPRVFRESGFSLADLSRP